ncbi:MAG: SDR family oxidoreductase [Bdellovibrionota bacterium]
MKMSQTVLITGASSGGIGFGFSEAFLKSGATVVVTARHPEKDEGMQGLKREYGNRYAARTLDLTGQKVESELDAIAREMGQLDILINCAGVYPKSDDNPLERASFDDWASAYLVNAVGPARVTRALLPALQKGSAPKLINITSLMGSIDDNASGGYYAYRMSKAALNMFNKSFSIDHPEIIAVVLHPGWVKTKMTGPEAPTTVEESVGGMMKVIEKLGRQDSGQFFDFEGDVLPW